MNYYENFLPFNSSRIIFSNYIFIARIVTRFSFPSWITNCVYAFFTAALKVSCAISWLREVLFFLRGNNRASSGSRMKRRRRRDARGGSNVPCKVSPGDNFFLSFRPPLRPFICRSTPPSIFCNFYQARFAPPSRANVFRQRPVALERLWILCFWPYFGRGREYLRMS